jgi:hypothetical protein
MFSASRYRFVLIAAAAWASGLTASSKSCAINPPLTINNEIKNILRMLRM